MKYLWFVDTFQEVCLYKNTITNGLQITNNQNVLHVVIISTYILFAFLKKSVSSVKNISSQFFMK